MNHVDKYWWIDSHPALNKDGGCTIELTPQMVCPETNFIEMDKSLNTKPVWWVELSYYIKNDIPELDYLGDTVSCHAWKCDCGGDTAEEAIDNLYELVLENYGDY